MGDRNSTCNRSIRMSYLIRYACFLRIFFLNPIIHIASISPSVKHAAIFLCQATRGSFKTVYEDSDTEGGPILCQRVLHQLFKPSVESGISIHFLYYTTYYYGVVF